MAWTVAPVRPAVVYHFSEDPDVRDFVPHVPRSNPTAPAAVWAIEPAYAPLYWFPRDCPRVAVWANDVGQRAVLRELWGSTASRLHFAARVDEAAMHRTRLHRYSFAPEPFEPWADAEGQWIAGVAVRPSEVVAMGDLAEAHGGAGVDLRFDDDLAARRDEVLGSGLPFSIVRWRAR